MGLSGLEGRRSQDYQYPRSYMCSLTEQESMREREHHNHDQDKAVTEEELINESSLVTQK